MKKRLGSALIREGVEIGCGQQVRFWQRQWDGTMRPAVGTVVGIYRDTESRQHGGHLCAAYLQITAYGAQYDEPAESCWSVTAVAA